MNFIKHFNKISQKDTALAGGKGASLGEMARTGIPIPGGFVVLTSAFEKFLEETKIDSEIEKILEKINIEDAKSVAKSSKVLNNLICKSEMPEDIEKEILAEFNKLKRDRTSVVIVDSCLRRNDNTEYRGNNKAVPLYVAVRNSATSEDSKVDSWAGQLESYLNVTEKNLVENIKKCWASLYSERALFYGVKRNTHPEIPLTPFYKGGTFKMSEKNSVAVVVQKMIQSEVSGVCFTVHPINKNKDQLIIESGYGLGEAIVSGMITPDNYVIDKNSLKILDKNIFDQKKMIIKTGGENKIVPVDPKKSKLQKLSDSDIIKLSEVCVKIEKRYQKPQDIEWALEKNKLYILQSRPITTL